jgi:hypothetical protein
VQGARRTIADLQEQVVLYQQRLQDLTAAAAESERALLQEAAAHKIASQRFALALNEVSQQLKDAGATRDGDGGNLEERLEHIKKGVHALVQRAVFLEKEGGGDCAGDGSSRPGSRPWSGQSAGGSSAGLLSSAQTPQPQDVRMGAAATVAAGGAKTWIGSAMRPGSASILRPPTSGRPMAVRPASAHAAGHGARQGVTPDLPHVFLPVHSADPALKAYSDDAAPRAFDHESGAPTLDDESKKWLSPPPLRSTGGGGEVHVRGSLTGVVPLAKRFRHCLLK